MRILLFDYSGHPFQVQLSRALAQRGHEVLHLFSAGFETPKGNLVRRPDDPPGFSIETVDSRKPFAKQSFVRRRSQEIEIGRAAARVLRRFRPDVVISSNAPLDTQRQFQREARRLGIRFVFWLQDIYSHAISRVVPRKFPVVGRLVAAWYRQIEFAMLRRSDAVVAITADFVPILTAHGVSEQRIAVIENWAPLDELPARPRDNPWAQANMAGSGARIVYSGTLGYKHKPQLLLRLARELPDAHVHVFSQGQVADALADQARAEGLENFSLSGWVPFADLPDMLSGADVFVAVIEPEAGVYSVPSKILTYLAIGRPILASIPPENLAAQLIGRHDAGFVSAPGDDAQTVAAARRLLDDSQLRDRQGANGRSYATQTFDIEVITDRFEQLIEPADGRAAMQGKAA